LKLYLEEETKAMIRRGKKAIILSKEESHNLKKRGKLSYSTNSSQITPRRGDLFEFRFSFSHQELINTTLFLIGPWWTLQGQIYDLALYVWQSILMTSRDIGDCNV